MLDVVAWHEWRRRFRVWTVCGFWRMLSVMRVNFMEIPNVNRKIAAGGPDDDFATWKAAILAAASPEETAGLTDAALRNAYDDGVEPEDGVAALAPYAISRSRSLGITVSEALRDMQARLPA